MINLADISKVILRGVSDALVNIWTTVVVPVGRLIKNIAEEVWKIESEIAQTRFFAALALMIAEEPIENNKISSSWYYSIFRELLGLPATMMGWLAGGVIYPLMLMSSQGLKAVFTTVANISLLDVPEHEQWKLIPVNFKGNYAQQFMRFLFSIPGGGLAIGPGLVITTGTLAWRFLINNLMNGPLHGSRWGLKHWFSTIEIISHARVIMAPGDLMNENQSVDEFLAKYKRELTRFEKFLGMPGFIVGYGLGLGGGAVYHAKSGIRHGIVQGTTLAWHPADRPEKYDIFKGEGWLSSSIHFTGFVMGSLSLGVVGFSLSIIIRFILNNFYGLWDALQWMTTQFKLAEQDQFTSFKLQPGTERPRSWLEVNMGFIGMTVGGLIGFVYVGAIKLRDSLKELFESIHAGFIHTMKMLWGNDSLAAKEPPHILIFYTLGAGIGWTVSLFSMLGYVPFKLLASVIVGADDVLARTWSLPVPETLEPRGLIRKMQAYLNVPFKFAGQLLPGVLIAGISVLGCGIWNGFAQGNNLILHKSTQLQEFPIHTMHINIATLTTLSFGSMVGNLVGFMTGVVFVGSYRIIGNSFDSFKRDSAGYVNFLFNHATFDAWKGDSVNRDNVSRYYGAPGRILAACTTGLVCIALKTLQYGGSLLIAVSLSPIVAARKARTMYTTPRFKPEDQGAIIKNIKALNASLNHAGHFDAPPVIKKDTEGNKGSISFIRKMFSANNYTLEEKVLDAVLNESRVSQPIEINTVVEAVHKDECNKFMRQSEVDLKRNQIRDLTTSVLNFVNGSTNTLDLNNFWTSNKQRVDLFYPDEQNSSIGPNL